MENINSGITMKPGAASDVRASSSQTIRSGQESVSGIQKVDAKSVQDGQEPKNPEFGHTTRVEEVTEGEVVREDHENVVNFADYVAAKAKRDGVDSAFEELAKDVDENGHRQIGEGKIKGENEFKEVDEMEDADPIRAEVEGLKARVESLSEQNTELKTRVEKIEAASNQALVNAYEMALILKKMIEEAEEDEEKKQSLLAMLAELMAQLITKMLVDEKDEEMSGNNVEKAAA